MISSKIYGVFLVVIMVVVIVVGYAIYKQDPLSPIEDCNKRSTAFKKNYPQYTSHGSPGGSSGTEVIKTCLSPNYGTCVALVKKTSTSDIPFVENYLEIIDLKTKRSLSLTVASTTAPLEHDALYKSKEYIGLQEDMQQLVRRTCE